MWHGAVSSQEVIGGVLGCFPDGLDLVSPLGALIVAFLALGAKLIPKNVMSPPGPRRRALLARGDAIHAKLVSSGSGSAGNLHCGGRRGRHGKNDSKLGKDLMQLAPDTLVEVMMMREDAHCSQKTTQRSNSRRKGKSTSSVTKTKTKTKIKPQKQAGELKEEV
ncbi:hypothetical protein QJQ45_015785 [Haematococcus lacustris]|nr:hypothetical protein QJQ45_015785 [Haematococcus lacustris]